MINVRAERSKVERDILYNGSEYVFNRSVLNEYGEPTSDFFEVCKIDGLFHVSEGYVQQVKTEGGHVRSKGQTFMLVLYDETLDIKVDDFVLIDGVKYNVTGVNDIGLLKVAIDISLEKVL